MKKKVIALVIITTEDEEEIILFDVEVGVGDLLLILREAAERAMFGLFKLLFTCC